MSRQDRRWNHNVHYYRLVLAAVPPGCERALDVGCGEGMLARQLAGRVRHVTGMAPGGRLVVGVARSRLPDLPRDAAAAAVNLGYRAARGYWQHPSPVLWPPPHTYRQIRAQAEDALPGVTYRRLLLWRYLLIWAKPSR